MKFSSFVSSMLAPLHRPTPVVSGNNKTKTERNNMKKTSKAILMAALGLALVPSVKASSGFDLVAGFTTGTGSDNLLDVGPVSSSAYQGATGLYNGETWDLTTDFGSSFTGSLAAGTAWGVIGDAGYNDGASTQTLWATTPGNVPPPITSDTSFAQADGGISAIESQDFGGGAIGYESNSGQTTTVAAGSENSWNQQTLSGSLASQFINSYNNPNVSGDTSDTLWQVAEGSAPVDLGNFSLSTAGNGDAILTFNVAPVPEPGTWALFSACGLLGLFLRHRIQGKQA
jgi:hypothetical protein